MARPRRIKKDTDAHYHLMSRTNDRRFLFEKGELKTELVAALRGIRAFHPRLAVVSHHQELTHTPPGRRTFAEALDRKTAAEEEGVRAVVPFWGDRIV